MIHDSDTLIVCQLKMKHHFLLEESNSGLLIIPHVQVKSIEPICIFHVFLASYKSVSRIIFLLHSTDL